MRGYRDSGKIKCPINIFERVQLIRASKKRRKNFLLFYPAVKKCTRDKIKRVSIRRVRIYKIFIKNNGLIINQRSRGIMSPGRVHRKPPLTDGETLKVARLQSLSMVNETAQGVANNGAQNKARRVSSEHRLKTAGLVKTLAL